LPVFPIGRLAVFLTSADSAGSEAAQSFSKTLASSVQIKHHADHADGRKNVDQPLQQSIRYKALDRIDVIRRSADQVAGALLIMKCQRQFLNVRVNRPSQIVCNPLS